MAIKLEDEWNDGDILEAVDLNDTFNATIDLAAKGLAQIPFTTLKSTGDWENEGNLAADRTTDNNGANDTINTGSTTAVFDNNPYFDLEENTKNEIGENATKPTSSGLYTPLLDYTETEDSGVSATSESFTVKKTYSNINAKINLIGASISASSNGSPDIYIVITYDDTTTFTSDTFNLSNNSTGVVRFGGWNKDKVVSTIEIYTQANDIGSNVLKWVEIRGEATASLIKFDTNILTLTGNENSFICYTSIENPVGSETIEVSDGTTTLSPSDISNNTSDVINISSLSSGQIEFTINFSAGGFPVFNGYGVYKS